MRGEITFRALHLLEEFTYNSIELFYASFIKSSKADYRALKKFKIHSHDTIAGRILESRRERQRFDTLISRLRTDGLIKKTAENGSLTLSLTYKGKETARDLEEKIRKHGLPIGHYTMEKAKRLTIISYDIPESEKRKRNWIRTVLSRHKFQMLHKSIWVGLIKLPEEFLKDITELKILPFVEIFSVSRSGTLKKIS